MKKVFFLKNKVFCKDDDGNLILNRAGKKIFRRDVGYSVAKALEEKLGVKVRITDDDTLVHNYDSIAINWGRRKGQNLFNNIFNDNFAIKNSVRKDRTYSILSVKGQRIPKFCFDREQAYQLFKAGGVVVRAVVDGKGGEGVSVLLPKVNKEIKSPADIPEAPLYTEFFAKTHEARYHIAFGEVLQVIEKKQMGADKRKANHVEGVDPHVRNHQNGWVHVKNNVNPALEDRQLKLAAVHAIRSIGLAFGAVDMMVKLNNEGALVDWAITEVNTAPGIEGSTLDAYTTAMADFLRGEL